MDDYKIQIEKIHGYKITDLDLTCIDKQYSCPGEFEENLEPILCKQGMHFSERLSDAAGYKPIAAYRSLMDRKGTLYARVFEVESYGLVDRGDDKVCTNKLRFIRELSIPETIEVLKKEFFNINVYAIERDQMHMLCESADRLEEQRLIHISLHNSELD